MNAINIIKHSDPHTTRVIQANKLSSHKGKQTNKKTSPKPETSLTYFGKLALKLNSSIQIWSKQLNIQVSYASLLILDKHPSSSTVQSRVSRSTSFIEKQRVHRRKKMNFNLLSDPLFYFTLVKGKLSTDTVH